MPPLPFLWDEEKTRKLFKLSLIIYIAGTLITVFYGIFLPSGTPYRPLIIFTPLTTIALSLINLIFINASKGMGWRFLFINLYVQFAASLFMSITGGFASPLQYSSYALLIITLFQLGPEASIIMGGFATLTFVGILLFELIKGGFPNPWLNFFVYTSPYILFVVIGRNIGKELSLQFEARKKLEEVDDLKNQFITLTSHYLRTPLTVIKGISSRIGNNDLQRSVGDLESITEKLLTISSIEKGGASVTLIPGNLNLLLREIVKEYEPEAKENNIALHFETTMPDFSMPFDPLKLKQAVASLIDNAIQYNKPSGSVLITLQQAKKGAAIAISDTGEGIEREKLENLFTAFNRGSMEEALKMNKPGLGLSLYIAKLIIDAHKGKISVVSIPGQGTTFTIILPLD